MADGPRQRIDTAHVTGQDLAGNRQSRWQYDTGAEGPHTGRYRANDRKLGCLAEFHWRYDQRRTAAALLAPNAEIEIGPDEVAGFRRVRHRPTRRSRGPCPAPNQKPRALPPVSFLLTDQPRHSGDAPA